MGRLLILLLGVAIGALLIVFVMDDRPDESSSEKPPSRDVSLKVEGATGTDDGIELQRSADLIQSAQQTSISTAITDPNASVPRTLHVPDAALTAVTQGLPLKLYIKDANGSVPSTLTKVPAGLLSQNRFGPKVAQPDSAFMGRFQEPRPSVQSAAAQAKVRPVTGNADSARLSRTQRPDRLLEDVGEASSTESP